MIQDHDSVTELRKIEQLEEQVHQALLKSKQGEESVRFDENFLKQELKQMQERCFQNQQTMQRIEQKYMKTETSSNNITKDSPLQKSSIKQMKQSGVMVVEQKNQTIQELQQKILSMERLLQNRSTEDQMRIDQLEAENQQLREQIQHSETIDLQRALDQLQDQYLELQQKLQETLRCDQDDYNQLKQEYEEYQQLTQNIINQEEDYQRRICELEEELQQNQEFQQDFLHRLNKNEEIFQQRYRELKQKYSTQLDDQRRILDAQIDELRDQNNQLFSQLQNYECQMQQLEFEQKVKTQQDMDISRSKSYSAYQQQPVLQAYETDKNKAQYFGGFSQQSSTKSRQTIQFNQHQQHIQQPAPRPVKQINLSMDKENSDQFKGRSISKEFMPQPVTYKQLTEQRQQQLKPKSLQRRY